MKVGNQLEVKEGAQWTFGNKTAEVFDSHVVNSIPLYKEGHSLICYLSDFLLGVGRGATILVHLPEPYYSQFIIGTLI